MSIQGQLDALLNPVTQRPRLTEQTASQTLWRAPKGGHTHLHALAGKSCANFPSQLMARINHMVPSKDIAVKKCNPTAYPGGREQENPGTCSWPPRQRPVPLFCQCFPYSGIPLSSWSPVAESGKRGQVLQGVTDRQKVIIEWMLLPPCFSHQETNPQSRAVPKGGAEAQWLAKFQGRPDAGLTHIWKGALTSSNTALSSPGREPGPTGGFPEVTSGAGLEPSSPRTKTRIFTMAHLLPSMNRSWSERSGGEDRGWKVGVWPPRQIVPFWGHLIKAFPHA